MSKIKKFIKTPKLFVQDGIDNFMKNSQHSGLKVENSGTSKLDVSAKKPVAKNANKIVKDTRDDDLKLAEKLINFEKSYPVNALKMANNNEDLLLWPFFRHLFWVKSQAHYKGKNPKVVNTSKMYISPEWQKHYKSSFDIKNVDEIETDSIDFLFFTNLRGTEQTITGKKIYNRVTDPIYEVAKSVGKAKKVEIIKSTGEIYNKRVHEADLVFPPLLRKIGYANLTQKPLDFIKRVNDLIPEIQFCEKNYNDCIEWFFHQRDFYKELLQKYNPKYVFFVGFDYHYALVLAAKELGIKSIDLQHGVQAGWSPVYNHWTCVPRKSYSMLPDMFWVWGEYDARKIKENFKSKQVSALVGGFPWLDRQSDFLTEKAPKFIRVKNADLSFGLITLQDQTTFPDLFKKVIDSTKGRIKWIIKRHPKHRNIDLSQVKSITHYGKELDDLSFSTLVKHMDIHMTECSTSVIEADYFGVPSIVSGKQGMTNYEDFVNDGSVFHISNVESFNKIIDKTLATREPGQMNAIDNSTTEIAIKKLMGDICE